MPVRAKRHNQSPAPFTDKKVERADRFFTGNDYKKAEPLYAAALKQNPTDIDITYRYAVCLHHNQKLTEALSALTKAAAIIPRSDVLTEMGDIYVELTMMDKAKTAYENAIASDEKNSKAWSGIALFYHKDNKPEHAILLMNKARELALSANNGDVHLYRYYLCLILKNIRINVFNEIFKQIILDIFRSDSLPHEYCSTAWLQLVNKDPALVNYLTSLSTPSFEEFRTQVDKNPDMTPFSDPFFYMGVRQTNLPNIGMERVYGHFRHYFLERIANNTFISGHEELLYALAEQCFFNEYVLFVTEEEKELLNKLLNELQNTPLEAIENLPLKLAISGCYRALFELQNAIGINDYAQRNLADDPLLAELVNVQISEPLEEQEIKKNIKTISQIEDTVSKKVREQYEENPYPRWKNHTSFTDNKRSVFGRVYFDNFECKDLLIAGCGTGRQIVINKLSFPDASITAIDISKSSIAYAQRKCCEMKYSNIKFYQTDILDLEKLEKKYDCIACTGVLHHMEDPFKGWQVLTNILKPGGYMNIGLYSETARKHIVETREFIAQNNYPATLDGIRDCREHIKNLPQGHKIRKILKSSDFYTTSGCRDLIFHVQEHRYTIAQLRETLEKLGLVFVRMIFRDNAAHNAYALQFPDDKTAKNLDYIEQYEQEQPDTFIGMYQFWVYKPPAT